MKYFIKKHLGLFIILVLSLIPGIIWFYLEPLNYRFLDVNTALTSLGQLAGLIGLALFSINLILSGRFKFIDRVFLGMDRAYRIHQYLGAIAFSLILFHPLFLVFKYLQISVTSAALFFIPGQNFANTFGIISLFLFVALMVITFYLKVKYQYWKISHKFMNLVFVVGLFHVILVTSDTSRSPMLLSYLLTLAVIGLLVGLYRSFIRQSVNNDIKYLVKSVKSLNDQIIQIEAEPVDNKLKFKSGQFVYVRFDDTKIGQEIHPFSIASSGDKENIRLVIKSLGDFTGQLKNLKVGSAFSIEGPLGYFSYKNSTLKKQLWIAGGIGITPFLSMAHDLVNNKQYEVDLYYCTKNATEAVLIDELIQLSEQNDNLKVIPWYSAEKGQITAHKIAGISSDIIEREVYICGPERFSTAMSEQLHNLGIAKNKIHYEKFNLM